MGIKVKLQPGQLPAGWCPQGLSWQDICNLFFELGYGVITGDFSGVIIGDSIPEPEDRDKLWIKTSSGYPVRPFKFAGGQWLWPHEIPPSDQRAIIWLGTLADVAGIDLPENDNDDVTPTTGPFWQVATELQAVFPIGTGTLPDGTPINPGDAGGNQLVEIQKTNLPNVGIGLPNNVIAQPGGSSGSFSLNGDSGNDFKYQTLTDPLGDGTKLNIMPPYRTVVFIKRTARAYYTP